MEFDDGDTGRIPLSHIRLLPPDYKIHCENTHTHTHVNGNLFRPSRPSLLYPAVLHHLSSGSVGKHELLFH